MFFYKIDKAFFDRAADFYDGAAELGDFVIRVRRSAGFFDELFAGKPRKGLIRVAFFVVQIFLQFFGR